MKNGINTNTKVTERIHSLLHRAQHMASALQGRKKSKERGTQTLVMERHFLNHMRLILKLYIISIYIHINITIHITICLYVYTLTHKEITVEIIFLLILMVGDINHLK